MTSMTKTKKLLLALCVFLVTVTAMVVSVTREEPQEATRSEEDALVVKSRADAALMWASLPQQDRDVICRDLDRHGWDWTVTAFKSEVPLAEQDATNWDTVVAYVVERCA